MTLRQYSMCNAWKMLCGYAAALQHSGDTPSASGLAQRLGFAASTGVTLRFACIELGWLDVVEKPSASSPGVLRLTEAGRTAVNRGHPPPRPARKPPVNQAKKPSAPIATAAKGKRRCLTCGNPFDSEGPHNRICPSCRGTEAFRSSVDSFAVRI